MAQQTLDLDSILADARQAAELEDFGSGDFLPGLRALIQTYDSDIYDERGSRRGRRRLVQLLATRLRVQDSRPIARIGPAESEHWIFLDSPRASPLGFEATRGTSWENRQHAWAT